MERPEENPYASPAAPPPRLSFSLASLMLWMTLAGLLLGLIVTLPGLGIPIAVLCAPAGIRASLAASRRRRAGFPLDVVEKTGLFFSSLLVVTVIAAASGATFTTICFPLGALAFGNTGNSATAIFVAAWGLGLLAGGLVLFFLGRRLWPLRDKHPGGP